MASGAGLQWLLGGSAVLTAAAVVVGLLVTILVTVASHELGHVLFGKLGGYGFERVSFGSGRTLVAFSVKGTRVELNAGVLDGQVQPSAARHPDSAISQILLSLGGILANAVVAVAAALAWVLFELSVAAQIALVAIAIGNAIYMAISLPPYAARDTDGQYYELDGYQVARTLRLGPSLAAQGDYMALVTPHFAADFEPAPSRAAREVVAHVTALRAARWCGGDAGESQRRLAELVARRRLTAAEERLVCETLSTQPAQRGR